MKTGNTSEKEVGQVVEFHASVLRKLPRDMESEVMQGWIDNPQALRKVLRNGLMPPDSSLLFKHDKTKEGWKLKQDVPFNGPFLPDIVEFLKDGESKVMGHEMRGRALELDANLGQLDLEYLEDHQELIQTEWRGKYYLVAPGTVWQDLVGDLYVPCLRWSADQLVLRFDWLGDGYFGSARLLRPRK